MISHTALSRKRIKKKSYLTWNDSSRRPYIVEMEVSSRFLSKHPTVERKTTKYESKINKQLSYIYNLLKKLTK